MTKREALILKEFLKMLEADKSLMLMARSLWPDFDLQIQKLKEPGSQEDSIPPGRLLN